MFNGPVKGGQLDDRLERQFRKQLRQYSLIYLSSQAYGNNTAHSLRKRSQLLLLAKQETNLGWGIH